MRSERYAKSLVMIDRCTCGVWLDGGELEKIQRYRELRLADLLAQRNDAERAEVERTFARMYFDLGQRV